MDTGFRRYDGIGNRDFAKKFGFRIPLSNSRLETQNSQLTILSDLRSRRVGRKQNIHQLVERGVSFLANLVELNRADRMLYDQHRMIWRAERFLFRLRQCGESMSDQRDREATALLNLE